MSDQSASDTARTGGGKSGEPSGAEKHLFSDKELSRMGYESWTRPAKDCDEDGESEQPGENA